MPEYTHGHSPSVLRSHTWRTIDNSAAFLKPHLRATDRLLDLGCGPGTITCDFAALLEQGHVTGVDPGEGVLKQARATANERGLSNITFEVADGTALPYPDQHFDVVYAHQVLQHVNDPIAILREMRRVCKVGGIVAIRDTDYAAFRWFPDDDRLDEWREMYLKTTKANGGEATAGRMLHSWARRAGYTREEVECSTTAWCFRTPEEIEWWGSLWADRIVDSNLATTSKAHGFATAESLQRMAQAFRDWMGDEDAWFSCLNGEILCRRRG